MEKAEIRIIAGSLRGRKLSAVVHPGLRPTPQRVRESFFSILGNAIPERPFVDVFAGTGVVGLEALSRGATQTTFVERDHRLAEKIERYVRDFDVGDRATVYRTDVYRWAERWRPPAEPVNVFLSPPFPDLTERAADFFKLVATLQEKLVPGSVLTLQLEDLFEVETLPDAGRWEVRTYGRNSLSFWEPADAPAESNLHQ